MDEWFRIMRWIRETLNAAPSKPTGMGSKIYRILAPQNTPTPYVVVQPSSGHDIRVLGGPRIMVEADVMVKVIDKPQYADSIVAIMDWIDASLDRKTGTTTGLTVMSCLRQGSMINYVDDQQYEHAGMEFRIIAQAS